MASWPPVIKVNLKFCLDPSTLKSTVCLFVHFEMCVHAHSSVSVSSCSRSIWFILGLSLLIHIQPLQGSAWLLTHTNTPSHTHIHSKLHVHGGSVYLFKSQPYFSFFRLSLDPLIPRGWITSEQPSSNSSELWLMTRMLLKWNCLDRNQNTLTTMSFLCEQSAFGLCIYWRAFLLS